MVVVRDGYKMTELGEIPVEWELGKIGDIARNVNKKFEPKSNGSKKYIALEHINPERGTINSYGDSTESLSTKT